MNAVPATIRKLTCMLIFPAVLVLALSGSATAQNVLATVSIPTASAGQVAFNTALNKIYTGGSQSGSSLTVIDGSTFSVITTISGSAGVSVDMKNDNFWTGAGTAGNVVTYSKSNTQIQSVSVGSCPAAVTFDCHGRSLWVASQCGSGNDPVWIFNGDSLAEVGTAIPTGGTISPAPVVSPFPFGRLYVTSGGVSKEIDPKTFAVSNTLFGGTVLAIDSLTNKLIALSGTNLQIVNSKTEAVTKTVALKYTPAAAGVNNALGHIYLSNPAGNSIDVYSQAGSILATFTLSSGSQPNGMAVDSVRGRLFVDVFNTGTSTWSLYVIEDLSTARRCGAGGSCDY
jgi:hypothetical protein